MRLHAAALVLGLVVTGCDDSSDAPIVGPNPDTFFDTGVPIDVPPDSASFDTFPPETGIDTFTDTGPDTRDTSGDVSGEPITGTALDGIVVTWEAPLELCNAWREGATVEAEVAHKVHLSIPPQPRSDLAFATLKGAAMNGVKVKTGPFAGESLLPIADTRVSYFDLVEGDGYDALGAEITHDLGPGGVLIESYSVTRAPGQTGKVEIGNGFEVTFAWAPEGGGEPHPLESCSIPDNYETAIAVLPAPAATPGGLSATLLRWYGTLYSEFSAGSYPVRLITSQVILSDEPYRIFQASGPWAQTYAAQHHNWGETSRIDFAKDLGTWFTLFQPLAAGEEIWAGAVSKVQLEDVGGGTAGKAIITRLSATGAPTDVTFTTANAWRRVDGNHLRRELAATCQGTVGAVGFGDHVAQLMLCPDASGPRGNRLVGIVPVMWNVDPSVVGEVVTADRISTLSGRLGWSATIGTSTFIVEPQENGGFITDVLDKDGTSVGNAYADLYELGVMGGWDSPIEAAADGGIRVSIARRWAAQGVGESSIYAPESMLLTWGDNAYLVDAWDRLAYVNTHHNWNDTLDATTDDGHVLHWKIIYDFENAQGLVQSVWVTDADGNEVLAPTVVTPVDSGG